MKKKLRYITIEYSDKDAPYIDELCGQIDLSCNEIIDFLNIKEFGEKVNIKLFDDLNEFRTFNVNSLKKYISVEEIPKWLCGCAKRNSVYTLCLEEYVKTKDHEEHTLEDLKNLVMHEFTHCCHNKIKNKSSYFWLAEGLAITFSHQYDTIDKTFNFTLEQAINGGSNYVNYYTMFSYVYETYGREYILELISDFKLLKEDTPKLYEETKYKYSDFKS